jgi:ribonuclease Z
MVEVTFLGTSAAIPGKERNMAAIHLRFLEHRMLWDCGEGTQRQMMRAGLSPYKVGSVFVSHLHADHVLGLAGLIQTTAFQGREEKLLVFGPPGIKKHVDFYRNWDYFECPFEIRAEVLKEGVNHETEDYKVSAFKVEHGFPAFGFVFEEKPGMNLDVRKLRSLGIEGSPVCRDLKARGRITVGRRTVRLEDVAMPARRGKKIAYTGDTRPTQNIVKWARDADLLICDATFSDELREKAHDYEHMTAADAARAAKAAGAKQLALTHISPRYEDASVLAEEARKIFKNTVVASDFLAMEI